MRELFCLNVGPKDAQSRRVTGVLALVGGTAALPSIVSSLPWLIVPVVIVMIVVGVWYFTSGIAGSGTWLFGILLTILGVVDWFTAGTGYGVWAFVIGGIVAIAGLATAASGRCPINAVLGVDTRSGTRNTTASSATPHHS